MLTHRILQIFIDYGENWEKAWSEHVKKFHAGLSRKDAKRGFSSKLLQELNADKFNSQFQMWTDDYFNVCRVANFPGTGLGKRKNYILRSRRKGVDERIELKTGEEANEYMNITYDHEGFDLIRSGGSYSSTFLPCTVFGLHQDSDGKSNDYYFDVGIFKGVKRRYIWRHRRVKMDFVEVIPRAAKSDQNWVGAFRHEILIPDEMIPPSWMDLAPDGKDPLQDVTAMQS
mmetsp:Transcript_28499/g.44324  ORF Transcript_28499/g.44324 Transcript_28499/m.44324 type:complete len:229 (+) Transcript_28499:1147-1833(+)